MAPTDSTLIIHAKASLCRHRKQEKANCMWLTVVFPHKHEHSFGVAVLVQCTLHPNISQDMPSLSCKTIPIIVLRINLIKNSRKVYNTDHTYRNLKINLH